MNNPELYKRRLQDFGELFVEVYQVNSIVNRIMQEYAYGNIITKEEALSKMVLMLVRSSHEYDKMYHAISQPIFQPKTVEDKQNKNNG